MHVTWSRLLELPRLFNLVGTGCPDAAIWGSCAHRPTGHNLRPTSRISRASLPKFKIRSGAATRQKSEQIPGTSVFPDIQALLDHGATDDTQTNGSDIASWDLATPPTADGPFKSSNSPPLRRLASGTCRQRGPTPGLWFAEAPPIKGQSPNPAGRLGIFSDRRRLCCDSR